jgi:hypothetical protein
VRILDVEADTEKLVCRPIRVEVTLASSRTPVEEVLTSKFHVRLHERCTGLTCRWYEKGNFNRGVVVILVTDSEGKEPFDKVYSKKQYNQANAL